MHSLSLLPFLIPPQVAAVGKLHKVAVRHGLHALLPYGAGCLPLLIN